MKLGKTIMVVMLESDGHEHIIYGKLLAFPDDGDGWYIETPNGIMVINPVSPRFVSIFQRTDNEKQVDSV